MIKKRKYDISLFDTAALSTALHDVNCHPIIRELAKRDLTLNQLKKILKSPNIDRCVKKLYKASVIIMYNAPKDKECLYQLSAHGKDKFIEYIRAEKMQGKS